jgi:hypothetical protein
MIRKLLQTLLRAKQRREFERWLAQPILTEPPSPPKAKRGYLLVAVGSGDYDILDGDHLAGAVYRQDGDEKGQSIWSATVAGASWDFSTLRAARVWLGNPPVRNGRGATASQQQGGHHT